MLITRFLINCGWSLRNRPNTNRWRGRNGITTIGDPDHGVPYGLDRLVVLHLAHLATQSRNAEVQGRIADLPRELDLPWLNSNNSARLARVAYCSHIRHSPDACQPPRRTLLVEHVRIGQESFAFKLSADFMRELETTVPASVPVIHGLARNPGALALYLWQAWNHHQGTAHDVYLFGPHSPFQIGPGKTARTKIRQMARKRQTLIRQHWPQCPYTVTRDTLQYRPPSEREPTIIMARPGRYERSAETPASPP